MAGPEIGGEQRALSVARPATVLIADNDPAIRRLLRTSLTTEGYRTLQAETGEQAISVQERSHPDLVLIDLSWPGIDGLELIRIMRRSSAAPIVVLSARDDDRAKVTALDNGADDYVTKPFSLPELTARLRLALRHRLQQEGTIPVLRSGALTVDLVRRVVTKGGSQVHLPRREYDILTLLATHAGKVVAYDQILQMVWGKKGNLQQLRVYVRQIRQKIEPDPEQPRQIVTELGVGYRFAALDSAGSAAGSHRGRRRGQS